jgi:hypothetical protein
MMSDLEARIESFLSELKELEKKHRFIMDHHAEFVSALYDTTEGTHFRLRKLVATLGEESEIFELYE